MVIGIDFDGTCVMHKYPFLGLDVPGCIDKLKSFIKDGHCLILITMRDGVHLEAAVRWFEDCKIPLLGINNNPGQSLWTTSPKIYANLYIDDAGYGCPLIYPCEGRPYVDWSKVEVPGGGS